MAACVCIECGKRNSDGLYRVYTGGSIQLLQCVSQYLSVVCLWGAILIYNHVLPPLQCHCDRFVDKYIEYDAVILLLDVLLLRIQSYRHVLFNYSISSVVIVKRGVAGGLPVIVYHTTVAMEIGWASGALQCLHKVPTATVRSVFRLHCSPAALSPSSAPITTWYV